MSKITQYSTIGALMSGHFVADFSLAESHSSTLFGIGCSCGVSGELTIYQGKFWEATAGEAVHRLQDSRVPFLQVTDFVAEKTFTTLELTDENIAQRLTQQQPIDNTFFAVNITSCFDQVVIRRPQRDPDPSRTIEEMSETQQVDTLHGIEGQLIGFWTPELFGRLSVPGFHFHFLSDYRQLSGHVLSFRTTTATVRYQPKHSIEISTPTSDDYAQLNIDISLLDKRISKVEK